LFVKIVPFSVAAIAITAMGCSHLSHAERQDYKTVPDDPSRNPDLAQHLNTRAITQIEKGKFDKAAETLSQALVADVTFGPAHNNLGRVYFAQGKYYLAAWELQYAVNGMPNRPEPHNNLGLVYEAVNKLPEALEHYEIACTMDDGNPEFLGNLVRLRLKMDERDPTVRPLLETLVYYDSRPDWSQWAREQLGVFIPPHQAVAYYEDADPKATSSVIERLPPPEPNVAH